MRNIIVSLIFLLVTSRGNAQDISSGDSLASEEIKSRTSFIYSNYDKVHFILTKKKFQGTTLGSNIYAYTKNDSLTRIVVISTTQKGIASTEYYFEKNSLIYVYRTFEYFQEITQHGPWRNFKGFFGWESRFYFLNNVLKYQYHSGRDKLAPEKEWKSILAESSELIRFIRNNSQES